MATVLRPSLDSRLAGPHGGVAVAARPAFRPLDLQRITKQAIGIMALMLLNKAGDAGALAFFVILLVMVLSSSRRAFEAIAICSVALLINNALVPKSLAWTPGRLVIPTLAIIRFVVDLASVRRGQFAIAPYLTLLIYVLVMAVCSVLGGWYPTIALLKLLNFWLLMSSVLLGVVVLRASKVDISEWFVGLIVATTGMAVLAIGLGVHDKSARFRGATGVFLGAFLHPNCHSIYASTFMAFLLSIYICTRYRNRWITLPLTAIWFIFSIWSRSRTSIVASLCGFVVLLWYARPLRNRFGEWMKANLSRSGIIAIVGLLILGLGVASTIQYGSPFASLIGFINKKNITEAIQTEDVLESREGLIEASWRNFLESPIYGIGFGLTKTEAFRESATMFTAPSEKGFLPTAVLEEGGLLGTAAFLLFMFTFVRDLVRQRNVPALAVFAAMLGANMTEVSIFSLGGSGFFAWTIVGAATILGDHIWIRPPARR